MTFKLRLASKIMCYGLVAILVSFILFVGISFAVAVAATKNNSHIWYEWQNNHIAALELEYENGTAPKIDEQRFCDFDIPAAYAYGAKLNDMKYLATHNSYKQGLSKETDFFYNRALPLIMGKQYDYVFDNMTEQLNQGIRSFELDLNPVKNDDGSIGFKCVHSEILEQQSSMIDGKKGLREFNMWSDYNPDHMPIILLIEPKVALDNESFDAFEAMFVEVFGDKLITSGEVLGEYNTFKEVRAANAYPTLESLKGRFMVVLHEKPNLLDTYIGRDPSMKTQKAFIAVQKNIPNFNKQPASGIEYFLDRALFLVVNEVKDHEVAIHQIKENNFMVRTRLDQFAMIDQQRKESALNTGAHILSTDYPYTASNRYAYVCQLTPDNRTMQLKINLN